MNEIQEQTTNKDGLPNAGDRKEFREPNNYIRYERQ